MNKKKMVKLYIVESLRDATYVINRSMNAYSDIPRFYEIYEPYYNLFEALDVKRRLEKVCDKHNFRVMTSEKTKERIYSIYR